MEVKDCFSSSWLLVTHSWGMSSRWGPDFHCGTRVVDYLQCSELLSMQPLVSFSTCWQETNRKREDLQVCPLKLEWFKGYFATCMEGNGGTWWKPLTGCTAMLAIRRAIACLLATIFFPFGIVISTPTENSAFVNFSEVTKYWLIIHNSSKKNSPIK